MAGEYLKKKQLRGEKEVLYKVKSKENTPSKPQPVETWDNSIKVDMPTPDGLKQQVSSINQHNPQEKPVPDQRLIINDQKKLKS